MSKLSEDPRIDPRLKALFGELDLPPSPNFASREEVLAEANSEEAVAMRAGLADFLAMSDTEEIAPSDGLTITTETFVSSPDGNTINVQMIVPHSDEPLPGVYYIHGGGDGVDVVLRRQLQGLGPNHRPKRRRRGHGRLPQLRDPVVGAGG